MSELASVDLFDPLSPARGIRQLVRPPAPAAGAGIVIPVPGISEWRITSVQFTVTTSAAVANRTPIIRVQDADGLSILDVTAGATVSAGNVRVVSAAPGMFRSNAAVANWLNVPIPSLFLQPGWALALVVDAIDVADQLSAITLDVDVFSTGPRGPGMGVRPILPGLDPLRR